MLETSTAVSKPLNGFTVRLSEELAHEAEAAVKKGNKAESIVLFVTAADLEEKAARGVSDSRTRRVHAARAASLWLKAGRRDEAERVEAEAAVADSGG